MCPDGRPVSQLRVPRWFSTLFRQSPEALLRGHFSTDYVIRQEEVSTTFPFWIPFDSSKQIEITEHFWRSKSTSEFGTDCIGSGNQNRLRPGPQCAGKVGIFVCSAARMGHRPCARIASRGNQTIHLCKSADILHSAAVDRRNRSFVKPPGAPQVADGA